MTGLAVAVALQVAAVAAMAGMLWVWVCVELDLPRVLELPGILAAVWVALWLAGLA